jgi:hypothetical protein
LQVLVQKSILAALERTYVVNRKISFYIIEYIL